MQGRDSGDPMSRCKLGRGEGKSAINAGSGFGDCLPASATQSPSWLILNLNLSDSLLFTKHGPVPLSPNSTVIGRLSLLLYRGAD